jgi:hypothetical protein
LPTTITLHHKGKIACASFTYSTNTSALPKNPLHHEGNLTHASIPSCCNVVLFGNALVLSFKI